MNAAYYIRSYALYAKEQCSATSRAMLYDSQSNALEFQTQCSWVLNSMLLGSKVNALSTQSQCSETLKAMLSSREKNRKGGTLRQNDDFLGQLYSKSWCSPLYSSKKVWLFQIKTVPLQHENPPSLFTMLKCAGRFYFYQVFFHK